MANTKISALSAGSALAGTEPAPFVQAGSTVGITAAQIKTFCSASPTLVTPVLGTPSSGTLTSCTGLPAAGVVGTAAVLGANTFTGTQTMLDAAVRQLYPDYTNTATVGAVVINKSAGQCIVAAGASSVTVTNSMVTTNSQVICTLATNDTTAILKNCVAGSGSFVVTLTATATGNTKVNFLVLNQ